MKHSLKPETVRALENAHSALACAFDHVQRDWYGATSGVNASPYQRSVNRKNLQTVFAAQLRVFNLIPKRQRKTTKQ